jgi:coproporphyrinogen III oxidase-like Fe-S oxidoreductase
VTPEVAALLRRNGVDRVSLGAQTFQPGLLRVLDRVAGPDDVRQAYYHLRDAGFDNISLDLIYGIPGQEPADLRDDIAAALALRPEHLSCYELEAKPGTRFAHAHGDELRRQAEAMEGYFERVVETIVGAGYRWYETANFARLDRDGRDLRARHNLAYWRGREYLGLGIGAVSTVRGRRWRTTPRLGLYLSALGAGQRARRELELLPYAVRREERIMLGLRLDEPLPLAGLAGEVDPGAVARLKRLGLARTVPLHGREDGASASALTLTREGRLLGDAVTVDLLA